MSAAPDLELINGCLARLRLDTDMIELVGATAIWDRAPQQQNGQPALPSDYVTVGPTNSIPADFDCVEGVEITVQFDAWSSGAGESFSSAKVRQIANAMRRSLHDAEFDIGETALVTLQHALTQILRDPDGVTNHAVVQFTATVETP